MIQIADENSVLSREELVAREEARVERVASWGRLAAGCLAAVLVVCEFLADSSPLNLALIRLGSAAALILYSSFFLFGYARPGVSRLHSFAMSLCDVTVATYLIWSYSVPLAGHGLTGAALFSVYFLALLLTAFHHDPWLPVFGGTAAILEYSALHLLVGNNFAEMSSVPAFVLRIAVLSLAAVGAVCICRRNRSIFGEMAASRLRYSDLVDRVPEMLFSIDKSGKFLWCNAGSVALLGMAPEAVVRRNISDVMTVPPSLGAEEGVVKSSGEVRDIEGTRKNVDYTLRRVSRDDGSEAWEGFMSDTTDRETAIAQREEMSHRLFLYQKMESLGTLASGMAHDFNNILQTIADIVGFVQKESAEPDTRKRMDLVSETLLDARFLVSELLALGRKQPLNCTSVNLFSFFGNIIPFFREQVGPAYEIVLKMPEEQLYIQGDSDYLKRIFQNLIGNARDAMCDGGSITLECFAVREKDKPGTVVVRFSDTGSGIPSELVERVFDPFFTTKKPGKGTGLGLALVRHVVSLHNGAVVVERSSGMGTTFRIEFPEAGREDGDLDTKEILLNRMSTRVLLVDDDVKIRDILRIFVRGMNYPICEAGNRSEAVEALARHSRDCDVVIMDWKLGTDDPHRVISELRAINPNLIVIVVSGYAPRAKSIETMKIHKWITKPYDKNVLDLEIQRALYRLRRSSAS